VKATLGLRQLLFAGAFRPGERLVEIGLGAKLGVSRTPLRLALMTLEHEGLVESLPGGGYAMRQFTRADVDDAIELRGVVEGLAARLGAERLESDAELDRLRETAAELDFVVHGEIDLARYTTLNERFHTLLTELAKSEAVARQVARLLALPFAAPRALLSSYASLPEAREILFVAQHQHRALLEALAARQGTRAEEIAREHARLARQNLDLVLERRDVIEQLSGAPLLSVIDGRNGHG
jgi:GntR family transcriptional regulator of vanillate catabolism